MIDSWLANGWLGWGRSPPLVQSLVLGGVTLWVEQTKWWTSPVVNLQESDLVEHVIAGGACQLSPQRHCLLPPLIWPILAGLWGDGEACVQG